MRFPERVLIAAGVLIFALGAGVALLARELANPHAAIEAGEPVVMTEECLSCHSDVFREAERAVRPMTIQAATAKTVAVAAVGTRTGELAVVSLDEGARPYAVTDPAAAPVRDEAGHVLLQTDDGLVALPVSPDAAGQMNGAAGEWCEACHLPTPTPALPGGV